MLNVIYQITCGMKRSVNQLVKTLMAEELISGRARVGDTVRKCKKNVAGIDNDLPGQVNCLGQRSDDRARWLQSLFDPLRPY